MRSFIALPIPLSIRKSICEEMAFLNSQNLKKVEEENLHFTLFFLGDFIKQKDKERFCDLILSVDFHSFDLSIGKGGIFYNEDSSPKTLWLGLSKGKEEMKKLRLVLLEKIKEFGFNFTEKFSPHLTIARVKRDVDRGLLKHFFELDFSEKFSFRAEKIVWFESRLSNKGPEYFSLVEKKFV